MTDSSIILDMPGATVLLDPAFLSEREAAELLERLTAEVAWEQHRVRMFGREVSSPRLSAWYGDPEAVYRYSGFTHRPRPWLPILDGMRRRVEAKLEVRFNSVLLNRYRDGRDAMGWHADDEPELGTKPVIASVSLGAARRITFRNRSRKDLKREVLLTTGSLLVMAGETQGNWMHAIPRSKSVHTERINLTFRLIRP